MLLWNGYMSLNLTLLLLAQHLEPCHDVIIDVLYPISVYAYIVCVWCIHTRDVRHQETSISTFLFMTLILGTIYNFYIEALGFNIDVILRYWQTPLLKICWYQRFVQYQLILILKIPWYQRFYFNIRVVQYWRIFDIDVWKHTNIDIFPFNIDFWVISLGPASAGQLTAISVCSSLLGTDCSEGSYTPSEGLSSRALPKPKWGWICHRAGQPASLLWLWWRGGATTFSLVYSLVFWPLCFSSNTLLIPSS
jgi:hypothetical protein